MRRGCCVKIVDVHCQGVVEVDCLASMDGLIWLRTGSRVASRVSVSQSTVSRNARKCAEVFAVDLVRRGGEWYLKGNLTLLNLERQVHQLVRWLDDQPLRLEGRLSTGLPHLSVHRLWMDGLPGILIFLSITGRCSCLGIMSLMLGSPHTQMSLLTIQILPPSI